MGLKKENFPLYGILSRQPTVRDSLQELFNAATAPGLKQRQRDRALYDFATFMRLISLSHAAANRAEEKMQKQTIAATEALYMDLADRGHERAEFQLDCIRRFYGPGAKEK